MSTYSDFTFVKSYDVPSVNCKVHVTSTGEIVIDSDDSANDHEAMRYVLEYVHTDRVAFKNETDPQLLAKISALAGKFGIARLKIIADNKLPGVTTKATVPDSPWWPNNKYTYEYLRGAVPNDQDHVDLHDLDIICTEAVSDTDPTQVEVARIPCDTSYFCSLSKLARNTLEGEFNNEQRATQTFTVSNCSKAIMECFVEFTYTRKFTLAKEEAVAALFVADKLMAPDVFIEVESLVMRNIEVGKSVDAIEPIAHELKSARIIQLIADIRKSGQDLTMFATNNT